MDLEDVFVSFGPPVDIHILFKDAQLLEVVFVKVFVNFVYLGCFIMVFALDGHADDVLGHGDKVSEHDLVRRVFLNLFLAVCIAKFTIYNIN